MQKTITNVWIEGKQNNIDLSFLGIDGYKIINEECHKFNGYKYERIFRSITEKSLYNSLTNKEIVDCSKLIKKFLDGVKKNKSQIESFSLEEAENFQHMLEVYGESGCQLHSW